MKKKGLKIPSQIRADVIMLNHNTVVTKVDRGTTRKKGLQILSLRACRHTTAGARRLQRRGAGHD